MGSLFGKEIDPESRRTAGLGAAAGEKITDPVGMVNNILTFDESFAIVPELYNAAEPEEKKWVRNQFGVEDGAIFEDRLKFAAHFGGIQDADIVEIVKDLKDKWPHLFQKSPEERSEREAAAEAAAEAWREILEAVEAEHERIELEEQTERERRQVAEEFERLSREVTELANHVKI